MDIKTVFDFNKALDMGPYTWPGGYPLFFYTSDGAALSWQAVIEEQALIRDSIIAYEYPAYHADGWRVVGVEVNCEDQELYCDHTGVKIESAYGEDDE